MDFDILLNIAAWAMGIALGALLIVYLIQYFMGALCPEHPLTEFLCRGKKSANKRRLTFWKLFLRTLTVLLIAQGFYWGMVTLISNFYENGLGTSLSTLWDAGQYYRLTENGYVNEGDARYGIVFYPLYPMVCRGLYLLGIPVLAAEYAVTLLCYLGAGMALYALIQSDYGSATANRTLVFFAFCPVSFFFVQPFTESMFVFLTLMAVYMAKRRKFLWAVVFGALSSSCRSLGVATAIPIFWEMLCALREKNTCAEYVSVSKWAAQIAACVLKTLPVALGLGAYLLINLSVTGNAFTFLTYQREHWGQTFGSPMNTLSYSLRYAIYYGDYFYQIGLWIPQTLAMLFVLLLMCVTWRRQKPRDSAYSLVYYYCAMAPTWLLSGMRYLTALYSVYVMLALITHKEWQYKTVLVVEIVMGIYLFAMYAIWGIVL